MTFFTHLECTRTGERYDVDGLHNLSATGAPLFARYDLDNLSASFSRDDLAGRAANMWRYREVMPLRDGDHEITLEEGFTPLRAAPRLGSWAGFSRLLIKDESVNPTGSFKARGLSAAVTAAAARGVTKLAIPTAGNAGGGRWPPTPPPRAWNATSSCRGTRPWPSRWRCAPAVPAWNWWTG